VPVGSSEALYQAMRFPHCPDWQREILEAPHAMQAKMKARKEGRRQKHSRPDWEAVQEEVMRWCLRVKPHGRLRPSERPSMSRPRRTAVTQYRTKVAEVLAERPVAGAIGSGLGA
jgi:hypothetical protein